MECCGCCSTQDPFEGSYEPERIPIAKANVGPRKIVLLGASNVGKTYLFHRLQNAPLPSENISTVGANFGTLQRRDDEHDKAYLWDTAGQERYESISPIYYRGADIVLIVYSPFVEASWLRAKKWLEDMPTMVPDARVVLVSTKQDLPSTPESQAMDVEAEGYIVALGYDLIKTSSVSGAGVEQLLRRVWEHLDAIAEANS